MAAKSESSTAGAWYAAFQCAVAPSRMSVTRRSPFCGGSAERVRSGSDADGINANRRSTDRNASSAFTSPTITSVALFGA